MEAAAATAYKHRPLILAFCGNVFLGRDLCSLSRELTN